MTVKTTRMKQTSPLLLDATQRLVAFETGGQLRNVEDATAAATRIYEKLSQQLSPIVGETGFLALFARTVNLTKPAFSGLQEIDTRGHADAALKQLCTCLSKQAPATITEIVRALIVTFVGLLANFIGEGLTWRLLRNAWPEALQDEPPSGEDV